MLRYIFCVFFRDIYLSFGISASTLISSVSHENESAIIFVKAHEVLVILSAILLSIKSPVTPAAF